MLKRPAICCVARAGFVRRLPPIQKFLARMIDVRRTRVSIAAHGFQRVNREQIEIIDIDNPARDLVRLLPGYLTG